MAGRETRQYWIDQLTEYWGGSAKSRNRSFCVLRKTKTGNFSVVTLRAATLKIPGFVFFVIHQKFSTGTFGTAAYWESGFTVQEYCELKDLQYESTRRWISQMKKEWEHGENKEAPLDFVEVTLPVTTGSNRENPAMGW